MSMPSALYCKSMIYIAKQLAKWAEKEPKNPTLDQMTRAMRNIHEYVEDLEVDNRRMKRMIVDHDSWVEERD